MSKVKKRNKRQHVSRVKGRQKKDNESGTNHRTRVVPLHDDFIGLEECLGCRRRWGRARKCLDGVKAHVGWSAILLTDENGNTLAFGPSSDPDALETLDLEPRDGGRRARERSGKEENFVVEDTNEVGF